MARTACLVCLVPSVSGRPKNALKEAALAAGTYQNLSNQLFLDIYETDLDIQQWPTCLVGWTDPARLPCLCLLLALLFCSCGFLTAVMTISSNSTVVSQST